MEKNKTMDYQKEQNLAASSASAEGKKVTAMEVAELCEKVAYARKAENIVRLDMTGMDTALADQYIICTGLSEPHIGAIAEHIQRECRNRLGIRPLVCDGTPQSHWMIVDFGTVMVHDLTEDARARYQLEELWGDVPKTDVIAKLDTEAKAGRKTAFPGE